MIDIENIKITVTDSPVFVLDDTRTKQFAEEYRGKPYGDVNLNTRMVYVPRD